MLRRQVLVVAGILSMLVGTGVVALRLSGGEPPAGRVEAVVGAGADGSAVAMFDAAPSASSSASPAPSRSRSAAPSPKPSTDAPRPLVATNLASALKSLPASTSQVVIVHSTSMSTTYATLETFRKTNGVWEPALGAMSARIGSKGFSDNHVEGVPTTPTGVYGFGSTMYGIKANPGVRYGYHRVVQYDWWNENSDSPGYNTFVHSTTNPGGPSEALWQEVPAYNHFAVINYNVSPAVPGKGSGIFLHVGTGGPTAGCVSLAESNLVRVLTWLSPGANPRIVMAPKSALGRY